MMEKVQLIGNIINEQREYTRNKMLLGPEQLEDQDARRDEPPISFKAILCLSVLIETASTYFRRIG